jgi:uncharacterized protein YdeI (YjbR/CyaY-like superfamily)
MQPRFFATPDEWRDWFERHHAAAAELWVGFYKRGTGRPSITWPESVDQALCFGWIDGVRRRIDDERYVIRFTPRRKGSTWSTVNVARVKELTRLGLMRPAGRLAHDTQAPAKTGIYSYERKRAKLPAALAAKFKRNRKAWTYFQAQPPWYRQLAVWWIVSAKKEETRERRLATLVTASAAGRSIRQLARPGPARADST